MTLRISLSELPADVRATLERGETIEIEADGKVIAQLHQCVSESDSRAHPLLRFIALRTLHGPLDADFEKDMALARELLNEPVVTEPWD